MGKDVHDTETIQNETYFIGKYQLTSRRIKGKGQELTIRINDKDKR